MMEGQSKDPGSQVEKNYNILPTELKLKILEKIPLHLRWGIASTSKEQYELVCDLDKFKHKLVLTPERVSKIHCINFNKSS